MALFDYIDVSLVANNDMSRTVAFSKMSATYALVALEQMKFRYNWVDMSDIDWDALETTLDRTVSEIMLNILTGAVIPFAGSMQDGLLLCDGSSYLRADYPRLYDILLPVYHIDSSSFNVPDLTDKFIKNAGVGNVGDVGGTSEVVLAINQMPRHRHSFNQVSLGIDIESVGIPDPTGVGLPMLPRNTGWKGNDQPHENEPPYHVLRYGIVSW